MKVLRIILYIFVATLILTATESCSTKRDKWLNRTWHSMNTRYNGYFNGNEAIKDAMATLNKNHKDDYYQILGVYRLGDKVMAQSVNPQTDRAIAKGVAMIKKHSMLINGKQKNKWIDDCYFIIGKANYLKREGLRAVQQLTFVIQTSEKESVRDLAHIFIIRSYTDLEEFSQAEVELNNLRDKKPAIEKTRDFQLALADYFIKIHDYPPAVAPLTELIATTKKKKEKSRYEFILGQIYRDLKRCPEAKMHFKNCMKLKPDYEMEFQAAINIAMCSEAGDNNNELKRLLSKMLKDDKNIDYHDQIHFALAILNHKEGKEDEALAAYHKSVRTSTLNTQQKGLSYLAMAEIHFAKNNFTKAQAYYDSTVTFLKKDHPRYEELTNLKDNLGEIVRNINIINEQDSLLALSKLSDKEKRKKVEAFIDKLRDDDIKKKEDEEKQLNAPPKPVNTISTDASGAKWYFYNTQTVQLGIADFKKIWGNRKNEDNWRRKNKAANMFTGDPTAQAEAIEAEKEKEKEIENTRYNPDTYLAMIPEGDSAIQAANEMILDAYYALGILYKQNLKNYRESGKSFEGLIKRSTQNKHVPKVYYQLYIIYKLLENNSKAEEYKNILLNKYPDSEYAILIKNPEFFKEKLSANKEAEVVYKQDFEAFKKQQYSTVVRISDEAIVNFAKSDLVPKFALLRAEAIGGLKGKDEYIKELELVSKNYPGSEAQKEAERIIALLRTGKSNETQNEGGPLFTKDNGDKHFYILLIPEPEFDINGLKIAFSNFNNEYFSNDGLNITATVVDADNQLLIVKEFAGKDRAITYLNAVESNSTLHLPEGMTLNPTPMIITSRNFQQLLKSKQIGEYVKFFYDNYKEQ